VYVDESNLCLNYVTEVNYVILWMNYVICG
jgi:hypothetical protein